MSDYEKMEEKYIFPSILWDFKYPDAPNDQFIKWVYDASNAAVRFQQGKEESINTGLGKIGTDSISVFSEQYPRAGNSSSGGWQSGSFTMEQTEFYPLVEFVWYIVEHVARTVGINYIDCQIAMWANLNYPYCYNGIHSHPSAHYSGVYYAQVPEGDCGSLMVYNPSFWTAVWLPPDGDLQGNVKTPNGLKYEIIPKVGTCQVFRADMLHEVSRNNTKEDRISFAFNLNYIMK